MDHQRRQEGPEALLLPVKTLSIAPSELVVALTVKPCNVPAL